jgi:hypothetical protein
MQIYDFIGITKQSITGIKNPTLNIEGTCTKEKASFVVLEDGEEIDFVKYDTKEENGFGIKAHLKIDSKYIKVYVLDGNKRLLIFSSKMSVLNRIAFKVEIICVNIYIGILAFFSVTGESLKYIWNKHKLLVPFSLWKSYFKRYGKRIKKVYYEKQEEHSNILD